MTYNFKGNFHLEADSSLLHYDGLLGGYSLWIWISKNSGAGLLISHGT